MTLKIIFFLNANQIPLIMLLNFTFILFCIGMVGIIWNKKNFLVLLLCIEVMFFSIALSFAFLSVYTHNDTGQIFCLLVVTAAAAETAIGLSILITAYRLGDEVTYDSLSTLRG